MPWLMLNRGALTILVHPETGDAWADHARHAAWLGGILPLDLDRLRDT
jgi:DOPA 4,5-dioxygenase